MAQFVTVRITQSSHRRVKKLLDMVIKSGGWQGVGLSRDVPVNLGTLMDEAVDALEARMRRTP